MMQRRRAVLSIAILLCVAATAPAAEKADRIFINGRIWTGDPAHPRAEALAVRDARIMAVGTTADIRRLAEKHTDVVDLKSRFVIPGFNDAHLHFMSGSLGLRTVALAGAESIEEIQRRIVDFAKAHPNESWIVGRGWSYGAFPGGLPHKRWLDAVVSDRPVWMTGYDGHTGWCNSAALAAARITSATPDPPGGAIVRDENGEPTGAFKEAGQELVRRLVPEPNEEERYQALKRGFDLAASYGITSIQNASFDLDDLPIYERLLREGAFKVRVYSALPIEKTNPAEHLDRYKEMKARFVNPLIRFGAVKVMVDGVVESKTAAMLEPYVGGGEGELLWTPEELKGAVALWDREGFQVWLHAIGDRAIRAGLDAIEAAAKANGPSRRRHRLEHIEVPQMAEIARFKPLGAIASTQALFPNPDQNTLEVYAANLGPERAARAMPFKLIDDAGAVQPFGSDWPVFTMEVLKGIYCAVTRTTAEGTPAGGWQPHLRITAEAALRHFTADAAFASFEEGFKGTLTPGKWADFAVLSDDILVAPAERILRIRVERTVMGGNDTFVFESPRTLTRD